MKPRQLLLRLYLIELDGSKDTWFRYGGGRLYTIDEATNFKEGRVQEISEITQGLKALAKELAIPVLALSQLSRAVETRDDKEQYYQTLRVWIY